MEKILRVDDKKYNKLKKISIIQFSITVAVSLMTVSLIVYGSILTKPVSTLASNTIIVTLGLIWILYIVLDVKYGNLTNVFILHEVNRYIVSSYNNLLHIEDTYKEEEYDITDLNTFSIIKRNSIEYIVFEFSVIDNISANKSKLHIELLNVYTDESIDELRKIAADWYDLDRIT